jgi:anti-sigma factor RsiW
MSACADRISMLNALLDGELDAINAAQQEAHLKTCSGCAAEFERLQALRTLLGAPGVASVAPQALRARIEAGIAAEAAPAPKSKTAWLAGGGAGLLAASLALVIVAPQLAQRDLDRQLVASHVRSLLASHLTDIATSNQHVVRPWFNGKVDVAPPAPELKDQGYPLVGGRLDYIDGRVAPAIVYRRQLHTVNLFVQPAEGRLFNGDRTARRDGYSLVEWTSGGLRYSAVSDIEMRDLQQFKRVFVASAPSR